MASHHRSVTFQVLLALAVILSSIGTTDDAFRPTEETGNSLFPQNYRLPASKQLMDPVEMADCPVKITSERQPALVISLLDLQSRTSGLRAPSDQTHSFIYNQDFF